MVLKDCERCLVYGEGGEILARARTALVGENIFLYFGDIGGLTDARMRVPIEFFDSIEGRVLARCQILIDRNPDYPRTAEPWVARCRILKVEKVLQRQRTPRVRVQMEMAFVSLQSGPFSGIIQNISAGGIYLTTDHALERGERFRFTHKFLEERRSLEAQVVWSRELPGKVYGYGCQFVDPDEKAVADVTVYVNRRLMKLGLARS